MKLLKLVLTSAICLTLGFYSPAGATDQAQQFELRLRQLLGDQATASAVIYAEEILSSAKSGRDLYLLLENRLALRDRPAFAKLVAKLKTIPKVKRSGKSLEFTDGPNQVSIEIADIYDFHFKINGVSWRYNPKVELGLQLEGLRKRLSAPEVSFLKLLIQDANAADPITLTAVVSTLVIAGVLALAAVFYEPIRDFSKPTIVRWGCKLFVHTEPKELLEADLKDYPQCAGYVARKKAEQPGEKVSGPLPDKPAEISGFRIDWGRTCPKPDSLVSLNVLRPSEHIEQRVQLTKKGEETIAKWIVSSFRRANGNGTYSADPERPELYRFDMTEDGHLTCIAPIDDKGNEIDLTYQANAAEALIKKRVCIADIIKAEKSESTLEADRASLKALRLAFNEKFLPHTRWSKIMIDECGIVPTPKDDPKTVNKAAVQK